MRDLQHWKDKVELSLDGRQVFFLFFGGAVLACLLFAVGVMTGRRIEARAIALESPGAEDPLAALDQLGDLEEEELTYHRALTKDTRGPKPKESAVVTTEPEPVAAPHVKPATKPATVVAPVVAPRAPLPGKPAPSAPARATAPATASPVVLASNKPVSVKETATIALKGEGKEVGAKEIAPKDVAEPAPVRFTLQLSAFAARGDADDFVRRVQAAGYRPFVISSDVPGKGLMYRVRIGDYASKDAALAEKTSVEKKLRVVAYLAKL